VNLVKIELEPVRGFRDYIPPESDELSAIEEAFRRVAMSFGYREVRTPTVERFELFALKSGEEIRKTMFVFKDKAGREVALRPEVTPSVVRLYLKQLNAFPKPIKVFYIANVFRYDEPQFGRYREFVQAGVEILGAESVYHDVELILFLEKFYDEIGLGERFYKVNDMGMLKLVAMRAGLSDDEVDHVLHLLDKAMYSEAISFLRSRGAQREASFIEELTGMDTITKVEEFEDLRKVVEKYFEDLLPRLETFKHYFSVLKGLGIDVRIYPSFARGIAYYTGIVFEARVPNFPISIAGGGRYDDLTVVYGGQPLKMTGFAIGVERTLLALKHLGKSVNIVYKPRVLLLVIDSMLEVIKYGVNVARKLIDAGIVVQLEIVERSRLGRMFEYASKQQFDYVCVVGPREYETRTVSLKNMREWKQVSVEEDRVVEEILNVVRTR